MFNQKTEQKKGLKYNCVPSTSKLVQIQKYKEVESERTDKVIHTSKKLKESCGLLMYKIDLR